MKKSFFSWAPVFIWCSFIFYLSSLRVKPPTGTWLDQVLPYLVHFIEYGVLFLLLKNALQNNRLAIFFGTFYGISDEFHQIFVPTRTADPIDILTDIIAMLSVWIIISKLLPKAQKRLKNLAKAWQIS